MLKITDFDDIPYNLPNLEQVKPDFEDFALLVEKDKLVKLLGYKFWKAMDTALKVTEVEEIWEKLRDGSEFDEGNKEWAGLKTLLVPIVYFEWTRETISKLTANGRVLSKSENSVLYDNVRYQANAYNDYSDHAIKLNEYLTENIEDYPEFTFTSPGRLNMMNL